MYYGRAIQEDQIEDLRNRIRKWERFDEEQAIIEAIRKAEKAGHARVDFNTLPRN